MGKNLFKLLPVKGNTYQYNQLIVQMIYLTQAQIIIVVFNNDVPQLYESNFNSDFVKIQLYESSSNLEL